MGSTSVRTLATTLALLVLPPSAGCANGTTQECFECSLTEEWARAERQAELDEQRRFEDGRERLRELVAAGEGMDPDHIDDIDEAFRSHDAWRAEALVEALEQQRCPRQAAVMLSAAYHSVRYDDPGVSYEVTQARRRAFLLIAASRGDEARDELAGCEDTAVANVCAEALRFVATGSGGCPRAAATPDSAPRAPQRSTVGIDS